MRAAAAVPVALLAVLAGGCGGSGSDREPRTGGDTSTLPASSASTAPSTGGAEPTEITVPCDRFADVAKRIIEAQYALYYDHDTAGDTSAVDDLVAELDALGEDAPDDVRDALSGLSDGFRSAQRLLEDSSPAAGEDLEDLAQQLSEDSRTVTDWIVAQCGGDSDR